MCREPIPWVSNLRFFVVLLFLLLPSDPWGFPGLTYWTSSQHLCYKHGSQDGPTGLGTHRLRRLSVPLLEYKILHKTVPLRPHPRDQPLSNLLGLRVVIIYRSILYFLLLLSAAILRFLALRIMQWEFSRDWTPLLKLSPMTWWP